MNKRERRKAKIKKKSKSGYQKKMEKNNNSIMKPKCVQETPQVTKRRFQPLFFLIRQKSTNATASTTLI